MVRPPDRLRGAALATGVAFLLVMPPVAAEPNRGPGLSPPHASPRAEQPAPAVPGLRDNSTGNGATGRQDSHRPDEIDEPPASGCRYLERKLDLIV